MKITKPTLLIDESKCKANIERMANKFSEKGIRFRPHFKTHQSKDVGEWFREWGIAAITCSSVSMALYFADAGWQDITVAFPVNLLEANDIDSLARRIKLNLVVESIDVVKALAAKLTAPTGIYIKVDTGYGRTGILSEDVAKISAVIDAIKAESNLNLIGFLAHAGHSYDAETAGEIREINSDAVRKMNGLKMQFRDSCGELDLSLGDTPTCSIAEDFEGINEVHPGNFVYYDLWQQRLGACRFEDIAVAVAVPVVAVHEDRNEAVIYGGAIHFSKDQFTEHGTKVFGRICRMNDTGWSAPIEGMVVRSLSQEHGIITGRKELIAALRPGELLAVLPVHSCLTANILGRGEIIGHGEIDFFRY